MRFGSLVPTEWAVQAQRWVGLRSFADSFYQMGKTILRRCRTPLRKCRTPLRRCRAPLRRCRTPLRRCRAPLRRCRAPLRRCRTPLRRSQSAVAKMPSAVAQMPSAVAKVQESRCEGAERRGEVAASRCEDAEGRCEDARGPLRTGWERMPIRGRRLTKTLHLTAGRFFFARLNRNAYRRNRRWPSGMTAANGPPAHFGGRPRGRPLEPQTTDDHHELR